MKLKSLLEKIKSHSEQRSQGGFSNHFSWWFDLPESDELLKILKQEIKEEKYDPEYRHESFLRDEIRKLARWFINRSITTSVAQAIQEFESYNNSDEIEATAILLIDQAYISDDDCDGYEFCNGVKVQNIQNTPFLQKYSMSNISERMALIMPYPYKITPDSLHPNINTEEEAYLKLIDCQRCISLVRNRYGLHPTTFTTIFADNIPIQPNTGIRLLNNIRPASLCPEILGCELKQANNLLEKFIKLDKDFQNQLSVSIDRLNFYNSGAQYADQLIDLRICLESVFLCDNNQHELRRTLALRAALFLGETLDEKKKIRKIMKNTYDATSKAVHTGESLSETDYKKKGKDVECAAKYANTAIKKLIHSGKVNWEAIELGSVMLDNKSL